VLASCLLALLDDGDDVDPVDRQTAALVLAESILMWRKSVR
jgi:hypothetical protein